MKLKHTLSALTLGMASLSAQAQTEIQWWHSMGGALGEWVNDHAKDFNASQTQYKIVPTFKGSYDESMTAAIAAFRARIFGFFDALPAGEHVVVAHGGVLRVVGEQLGLRRFAGNTGWLRFRWQERELLESWDPEHPR